VHAVNPSYWTDSGCYDIDWYLSADQNASVYYIDSEADLAGLAVLNNGLNGEPVDFTDKTINLEASLDFLSAHLWTPIGTSTTPFDGTFNGGNNSISGITIDNSTINYQGLFGVNAGTVKNVNAVSASIVGSSNNGIIAGMNNGNIVNCSASGTISGTGSITGGIVGSNYGSVTTSYNTGTVTGTNNVGGIVGSNSNSGSVTTSYNTGTVTGINNNVGGIAGQNAGYINGGYSVGALVGSNYVGGIAGFNAGTIAYMYFCGAATGIGGSSMTTGTTPFIQLQSNIISSNSSTTIVEQTDSPSINLGSEFNVSYSFTSSDSQIVTVSEGTTVYGLASGSTNISGTMTIKQNGLTPSGFTGGTLSIIVPVSIPLTVTKATPMLTIPVANPPSPEQYPSSINLSTVLSNFSGTTGGQTIDFYNVNTSLGNARTDSNGIAVFTWVNPAVADYSITAKFSEDSNNLAAVSGSLSYTVNKGTQAAFSITGLPSNSTTVYGNSPFSLSTAGGSGEGTVVFTGNNNSVLTVAANGAVTIKGAGEVTITATKEGNANYNESVATELITVNQKQLSVSVEPVTIDCGQAIPLLTVQVTGFAGSENAANLTGFSKPSAITTYGSTAAPVYGASADIVYSGGNATGNYYFAYNNIMQLTINAVNVNSGDYSVTGTSSVSSGPTVWNNSDLTITPTGGYTQISTDGTTWNSNITVSSEGANNSLTFYLKKNDGTRTEGKTIYYNLDITPPTGSIKIEKNEFTNFLNNITFGLFFKESTYVTIDGIDNVSGVAKIEYQIVQKGNSFTDTEGAWMVGNTFSVNPDQKFIVYARITDQAGNVMIINSNGVVVYTDSTLSAASANFDLNMTKPGYRDIQVTLTPAGNTIKDITLGDKILVMDTDYTVAGNVITIKKEYAYRLNTADRYIGQLEVYN